MKFKAVLTQAQRLITFLLYFSLLGSQLTFCSDHNLELPVKNSFLRSFYSLTVLASTETLIYDELTNYHAGVKDIPASLIWYLEDYLDSCTLVEKTKLRFKGENHDEIIAGHPLLAYRMVYRYVIHLRPMIKDFKNVSKLNATLSLHLRKIEGSIGWPERPDVENAMRGILRLHHVYDLNLLEFVTGTSDFNNSQPEPPFVQAIHCYELGHFAISQRHFDLAVEWIELGIFLVKQGIDKSLDLGTLNASLQTAISTHDHEWIPNPDHAPEFFTKKIKKKGKSIRQKRRTSQAILWRGQREPSFNTINFWGLCSGDDMRTDEEKSKLFCWYDSKSNPAWFINPLKIEQLGKSPSVLQIYQVLPNHLIEKLKIDSQHSLIKSQVYSGAYAYNNMNGEQASRTSLNTWLNDGEIEELKSVPRRIELITGLNALPPSSSEMIQVATYTFGSHYEVHQDAFNDPNEYHAAQKGDRIATFMIYLSDVERGGMTAFPQIGIAAKPVKGSAIFWHNLKRNGQVDQNTWHGACPVIQGSKWVANKWIRANDQFLTRPCSLNPNE